MKPEVWRWQGGSFTSSLLSREESAWAERAEVSGGPLLVLPPLWDHHGHILALGSLLEEVDLRGATTLAVATERVRGHAERLPAGAWVVGFGWDQNLWGGAFPEAGDLLGVAGGRPCYLRRVDGHAAWVNGEALLRAGLPEAPEDPPGGAFLRRDGSVTGIVLDRAMEPFEAALPQADPEAVERRLLRALADLRGRGLCGVTEMGLEGPAAEGLLGLDAEGRLPLGVDAYALPERGAEPSRLGQGRSVRILGTKIYLDGALGSRGAALREAYTDAPGERGLLLETVETLRGKVRAACRTGLGVAIHAIGDRAIGLALDAAEGVGPHDLRLEHLQVLPEGDLGRLVALGATASVQPCHRLSDEGWAPSRLGERMAWSYRLGSLLRAGLPLRLGTDFPIEDPDPRRTIYAALTHPVAGEALGLAETLAAMAPPEGRAAPGDFTLVAGDPWFPGSRPEVVLGWEPAPPGARCGDLP